MPKYLDIARSLQGRLRRGDYDLAPIPGEKTLAKEFGVSYMTARRAVQELLAEGLLQRDSTGHARLIPASHADAQRDHLALLLPSAYIRGMGDWILSIQTVAEEMETTLRVVPYLDWDDPVVQEALGAGYSGLFLRIETEPPPLIVSSLRTASFGIVALFDDLIPLGIPCLDDNPPDATSRLIDYIASLGFERIDCFNAQATGPLLESWILEWERELAKRGISGHFHDFSQLPHGLSESRTYHGSLKVLSSKDPPAAVFCTTVVATLGLYRAAHELGLVLGEDLSVCARGAQDRARLFVPSLTCVVLPEREVQIRQAIKWMMANDRAKHLPKHGFRPIGGEIFVGDSSRRHP